jgi:hypothetical protein
MSIYGLISYTSINEVVNVEPQNLSGKIKPAISAVLGAMLI